jgi:hypothetical protein
MANKLDLTQLFSNKPETSQTRVKKIGGLDLDKMPLPEELDPSIKHITFGDLHGNALKFVHQLIQTGFIKKMSDKQYVELVRIYNKDVEQLTEKDLDKFKEIISQLEINNARALTLIGDELCDRGKNDYFTLLIMRKLSDAKVDFDVMVSNHSIEFIRDADKSESQAILDGTDASLRNYKRLRCRFPNIQAECDATISTIYKPRVRAVGYTYNPLTKELSLYSHAPIDLLIIHQLCRKYGVVFNSSDVSMLMQSIDNLNAKITNLLSTSDLFATVVPLDNDPLVRLIWNRDNFWARGENRRYLIGNGYTISFVHGHVGPGKRYSPNHENTDNDFGKEANREYSIAPVTFRVTSGLNKSDLDNAFQSILNQVNTLQDEEIKKSLQIILTMSCRYHTNVLEFVQSVSEEMRQDNLSGERFEELRAQCQKVETYLAIQARQIKWSAVLLTQAEVRREMDSQFLLNYTKFETPPTPLSIWNDYQLEKADLLDKICQKLEAMDNSTGELDRYKENLVDKLSNNLSIKDLNEILIATDNLSIIAALGTLGKKHGVIEAVDIYLNEIYSRVRDGEFLNTINKDLQKALNILSTAGEEIERIKTDEISKNYKEKTDAKVTAIKSALGDLNGLLSNEQPLTSALNITRKWWGWVSETRSLQNYKKNMEDLRQSQNGEVVPRREL